ncbi:hypothetical protein HMPREF9074_08566 [Capnocytophaga sp. oral taxon 329 str. F0087]|nr:hypothetical protein HMPREF9074_08566 [Capnocytophaga sp. oral taxon 329 str. F0087]
MLVVRFAMLKPKPNYRANVGTFFEKAKFNFKKNAPNGAYSFFRVSPVFKNR